MAGIGANLWQALAKVAVGQRRVKLEEHERAVHELTGETQENPGVTW